MKKQLTTTEIREKIRSSIKKDSRRGIWFSFWKDIDLSTY